MNIQQKHTEPLILSGRDVTAVLGPTNTGKTHLAIERMVAHETGVIGLPLRLLAREVYTRVCEKVGAHKVALITGEEKIQPPGAKYSVCTVEAMPRETDAAFVAIDEVQLAGDLERGHIFTDRILHLRGRQETLLLGAATMHGILQRLLKGVSVVTRPRLSHLAYAGSKKLTRLPRRTAIVAFSADEVYAIAELIRRQQGGAAVVLGALSPRTRNAQVALFQSGDVDYLIATDAIGMGLNLDLDHVAFAQNRKFDGYQYRNLTAAELGQIAGRAGRHLRDGTFGVTGQVDPLDEDLVQKIEGHDFDPVKVLQWRTAQFDFASLDALKRSIETNAPVEGLTRALPAVDAQALEHLSRDEGIRALATNAKRVALLWEACALPDYRKIAPAQHADLIASIYMDLARHGHVDENYMAEQVRRADTTEGDIDTLSHRIAQIRTWTFVSNRPGWLADQAHWQEKTREIEDRLSDALHERLTKRFVDRRTSVLMRRLRENTMPEAEISPTGTVLVEGHHVGELQGFRFTADQTAGGEDAKAVRTAAQKALAAEFDARAERFGACANGDLALGSDGTLRWIGAPIGTLVSGEDALKPRLVLLADEQLTGPARDKVAARAERFVNFQIESLLKPLVDLKNADQISGIGRGIAFQLVENFGLINRRDIAEEMKSLDQEGRAALRRLGVRFGAYHVFVPALIKPAPAGLVTLLWALKNDGKDKPGFGDVVHALASGRTSVVIDPAFDKAFYKLAGYRNLGRRAVRIDILERLADLIRPATNWKPGLGQRPDGAYDGQSFMVTPPMMSILGATADDMEEILKGLGYRAEPKPAADVKARLEAQDTAAREAAAAKQAAAEAARAEQAKAAEEAAAPAAEGSEPVPDAAAVAAMEVAAEIAADAPTEAAVQEQAEATADVAGGEEAPVAEAAVEPVEPAPVESRAEAETAEIDAAPPEEGAAAAEPAVGASAPTEAAEPVAVAQAVGETVPEAEAPKPILLWRQGRFDQRPRHRDGRNNRPQNGQARGRGNASADAGGAPATGTPTDRPAHEGRRDGAGKPRFDRSKFKPKPQGDGEQRRDGRPQGDRPERREGRPDWKGGRPEGKGGGKPAFQPKPREERPVRFDPDSPFAKLAALRDQLKK
ncbi:MULTISPECIES: helicase-related protein [unclassified Mesorhizobium]|uniref:helicase-related protein n=1 Tax=unclassified Mesorhizobium TaxID=325217 RepID=UPI000FDA598F|nr:MULTISPECIES: helicase-related protein [unclassified Mesorhizobium]TGR40525.1 helicase [bacterium M00.F.Ca.ET.199.01.1.1]TGU29501.1 helicase [bacterium M00.F.Ca.ET.156.01.1.1]TGR25064.1 helicase [Mesorhizobium sp. M8A.F.Ca.ET.197.01.1.1]TGR25518.1 helicase [Mesorhizobium sp. M8A.F.Ca.ET.202.01.1.1]TGR49450.1 helicase [Mesorhizobium sp. M8A.F.Ca.ET.198.01.1.1]